MADGWLIEGIKFIGGIAGLGTAAFTIWDRLFRDRPLVSLYANNDTKWLEPELSIRIKNVADEHILIRAVHLSRDELKVYPDQTLRTVIGVALGQERFALIEPKSDRSFILFDHADLLKRTELIPIIIEVEWSKTGRRYLNGRVTLRTNNHELAHIVTDAEALRENRRASV